MTGFQSLRFRIGLFGIAGAILYSSLLPLWEGFDEPFHYAYVASLGCTGSFPVMRATTLPADVVTSLRLAPASTAVKHNLPFAPTYEQYFRLPELQRAAVHSHILALGHGCQW